MPIRSVTRRRFLAGALASASAVALAACAPQPTPAPTSIPQPADTAEAPAKATAEAPVDASAAGPAAALANGEGMLAELDGELVALYRDDAGALIKLSPKCPHRGCDVEWNDADKVWDCPCHRSQFAADGSLIAGPATTGLERIG